MDELRIQIWDYLYRQGEPQLIAALAEQMNVPADRIEQTVTDPWFEVQGDLVAIAESTH